MKIAVIGVGGVGGYFGGKIAHAGYDVTFVARGENLRAIREHGLRILSVAGDFAVHPAQVTDNLVDIRNADLIILGVQAWQVQTVARELKHLIRPDATILPLQNGVLAAEELSAELGTSCVIGGLCRIFSKIEKPGVISHLGIEPTIIFGELDNGPSERIMKLAEVFGHSGIKSRATDNIQVELWKKFINICVSGLLAITRSTYGEIRELKETRNLMIELFEEIYQLSQKMGIAVEHDFIARTVSFIDSFPHDATSSLTRDVWEGKPSEIEYQNGTVVRLGEKYGVNTPVNSFIYHCILPMEIRARQQTTNK